MKALTEHDLMQFLVSTSEQLDNLGLRRSLARLPLRELRLKGMEEATEAIFAFEDLMMAIRRDLGHGNRHFHRGTLLGLFVNDIDRLLSLEKNPKVL